MATRKKNKKLAKRPEDYTLEEWAKKWNLDEYEMEIERAFEAGKMKPLPNQAKLRKEAQQIARNTMRKDARLNIRITNHDLTQLKMKAAVEGLPYQTLAASIIHKFVHGAPNYRVEG